jgi:hypothetical protein
MEVARSPDGAAAAEPATDAPVVAAAGSASGEPPANAGRIGVTSDQAREMIATLAGGSRVATA